MDTPQDIKVTRIAPPVLRVRDLQKAETFFRSALGFDVKERTRSLEDDLAVVALVLPGSSVTLKLISETPESRSDVDLTKVSKQITLYVADVAETVEALRARGVEFEELPWTRRSGSPVRFARFLGPDEYSFELIQGTHD